jgi:hypothetical protein
MCLGGYIRKGLNTPRSPHYRSKPARVATIAINPTLTDGAVDVIHVVTFDLSKNNSI